MSKVYDFLIECKVFYLATVNNNLPAVRPFGAVMEIDNVLYFTTGTGKAVYNQLCENSNIQIVALKGGTRDWIRINGNAIEVRDLHIKQAMLQACPVLVKRYSSYDDPAFALFEIQNMHAVLNTNDGIIESQ